MDKIRKRETIVGQITDILDSGVFGPFNLIDRMRWVIGVIRKCNVGHRFKMVIPGKYVGQGQGMTLHQVTQLLQDRGILTYGYTHSANYFYFSVSTKQAEWAEYILLRAGIGDQLENPTFRHDKNVQWAGRHAGVPPAWKDRRKSPSPKPSSKSAPPKREGDLIDRLMEWI